ncbi:MAG: phosphoglucosamine mutase [Candidatus Caldatribacteriota bacterium]
MKKLFGTDGIRGIANQEPITPLTAFQLGRAGAYLIRNKNNPKILVGKDTRISGDMLETALMSGICSLGVDVLKVGIMPTPAISFLTRFFKADCGIVISASHNPFDNNGIKFFRRDGFKFSDKEEEVVEKVFFKDSTRNKWPTGKEIGKISYLSNNAVQIYLEYLKKSIPSDFKLSEFKIVLDCANGATYEVAAKIFNQLEAQLIVINNQPNGTNINLNCGSTQVEGLRREVVKQKADMGFAFDGDGDRVIAIDEKGNIVDGDQIMAVCALNLLQKDQLPHRRVVTTIMSNLGFDRLISQAGGNVIRTTVGDRYVLEAMLKSGAILGGEQSGHIIFLNHHNTGDGILTSLQLLKVIKEEEKSLSELAGVLKKYPQIMLNFPVKNKTDFLYQDNVLKIIQEAEKELEGKGRIFIRPSGTEPLIRILLEGEDGARLEEICGKFKEVFVKEKK